MKKSLLIRFRWPLFIVILTSALIAGIAFLYKNGEVATYSFVVMLFGMALAVVFNLIDEQTERSNFER